VTVAATSIRYAAAWKHMQAHLMAAASECAGANALSARHGDVIPVSILHCALHHHQATANPPLSKPKSPV
jgi:hypothetical protein